MCVVSMIGDHFNQKWNEPPYQKIIHSFSEVSRQEFEALRREVQEMKELLKKAKEYDEKHNEPNCEIEDKMAKLREIAKLVGIDLDDVLKSNK